MIDSRDKGGDETNPAGETGSERGRLAAKFYPFTSAKRNSWALRQMLSNNTRDISRTVTSQDP